ncbi:MAG: serine hydrolase domain-containing protein [Gemmatimonadaceae bacterium]
MTIASKAILFLSLSIVPAACATNSYNHTMNDQVDALMRKYDGQVPGASVLVVKDGTAVVRRSWGMSDLENHVSASPATNYRLASVTKQFTAAAILLLREDKKLALDDRVRTWFPSLPKALDSVTIEHLLTHTSGIIDYEDLIPKGTTTQVHDADVLRLLESADSTYFTPGSKYQYSNSGYSLLALIVERASGKRFATFLHDRIFVPIGMSHTVAYENGISTVSNRAFGYTMKGGTWIKKDQSTTSAVLGDGGIYSSIDDMAKWDAALYDSRLLSEESRRLAFTPHTATDKPDVKYGFGWRITGESLWHSGETSGFRNVIIRYPSRRLTVVMLTNRDDPPPYETALAIANIF